MYQTILISKILFLTWDRIIGINLNVDMETEYIKICYNWNDDLKTTEQEYVMIKIEIWIYSHEIFNIPRNFPSTGISLQFQRAAGKILYILYILWPFSLILASSSLISSIKFHCPNPKILRCNNCETFPKIHFIKN